MIYNRDYNYEISIWTLQDSFITVLKNSNLEQEGWLQDGSIEINVDGTQNLSFSIPMYIYQDGIQQENPIWYNTTNGNLIANMRKIKVIINKNNPEEKVYEFLITKVIERHETDQLYCDVEGEGLAFHELGKIGYKISLTSENLSLIDLDSTELPHNNLQYWLKEASIDEYSENLDSSTWGYEIKIEQLDGQTSDIIYEDDYLTWGIENDYLISTGNSGVEKYRPVDIEESNIYNITQKLAEIFGVFCRYEYEYDDNFHIQHRKIIFYNNFLQEKEGYIDLTYPYSTNSIKRNIDSTDLITKMYVRPVNAGANSDMVTIMNTPANKGMEDYILNFDYLYSIGTITKEQYEAIDIYREDLHKLNNSIDDLSIKINAIEAQLPKLEATITTLNNSIQLDKNGPEPINNLTDSLTNGTGVIEITKDNPETAVLLDEENATGRYYIKLKQVGIIPGTIRVYRDWSTNNNNNKVLSGLLSGGLLEYDEFGGVTEIHNLLWESDDLNAPKIVYLIYSYNPSVYYEKVSAYWAKKYKQDQDNLNNAVNKLNDYNEKLEKETESGDKVGYKIDLAKKIDEKNERIKNFNKLMGPAIREGYWQPEDYKDHVKVYHDVYMGIKNNNIAWGINNSRKSVFEWSASFDDEEQTSYKIGIEEESKNYLAVDLSDLSSIENKTKENITNLNFIFHTGSGNKDLRCFPIGSECQLCYLYTSNKELKPILLLTGAKNLTDSECQILGNGNIYIANLKFNENTKINEYDTTTGQKIDSGDLFTLSRGDKIYYPRIRIDDLNLKLDSDQLLIKYNGTILEQYKDYYITFKTNEEGADSPYSYYITIKPEILIKDTSTESILDIKFTFSTAADYIYLDAVQILKENAYPKVSYEISPSVINDKYLGKTYTMLNRIVNINDVKLKFENVQGYVSKVNLVLDKPWEDKIEIKNYKNKFEDLFSTIVAQTEEMKKNGNLISSLGGIFSNGGLNSEALEKTIYNNKTILQAYLDAGFDDSSVIEDKLTEVFNAAGEILKGASNSTSTISALNTKNAKILSEFAINVQENLTPNITYGTEPPKDFKEGDIWIQQDGEEKEIARYVCTTSRSNLKNYNPNKDSNFYDGWTKTFDGSLAQITGTRIQIDAEQGTIDLLAHNKINLKSGDNIYIAADTSVDIVGNKAVNIGGTQINIGSTVINGKEETGGINLVATSYQGIENFIDSSDSPDSISKVLINPLRIEMTSAEIEMAAGNGITMYASNDKQQTALKINKDKGIWMGSTWGINFFSGNSTIENWNKENTYSKGSIIYYEGKCYKSLRNGNKEQTPNASYSVYWKEITPNEAGASMSINSDKILFGVANSNQGTAVEMTKEYIILGVSIDAYEKLTSENFTIGQTNPTTASGIKITPNSIGFATGQDENRSTFLIDQAGLILAAGNTKNIKTATHIGSYVQIKPDGIDLGANGNLYINTSNIQLQTKQNEPIENNDNSFGTLFALGINLNDDNKRDPRLVLDGAGNLFIKGNITATSLSIVDGNNSKAFSEYIDALEKRIDDEIQTWFGKGKPLYNDTSSTTGSLKHNIVVETVKGKTVQHYEADKDTKDNNGYYKKDDIVYNDSYGYYKRLDHRVDENDPNSSFWERLTNIPKLDPTGKNDTRAYWNSYDNDKHIGDIYYDIAETFEQANPSLSSKWKGEWDSGNTYSKDDIVYDENDGKVYKSLKDENKSHRVSETGWWSRISPDSFSLTAGQAFRFIQDGNNGYKWQPIKDTITISTAERMERIRNGEVGLAFAGSGGNSFVTLNNTDGLVIMGKQQTNNNGNSYYPFFKATNDAMGFFRAENSTSALTDDDEMLLYFEDGELIVKGNITATSFTLGSGVTIPQSGINGLTGKLNSLQEDINTAKAISADVQYQASSSGTTVPTGTWTKTIPSVTAGQYLWTRTITTYAGGNTSTSYSVSKQGADGKKGEKGDPGEKGEKGDPGEATAGKSVSSITPLYCLKNNTTAPRKPTSHITSTSTSKDVWTTVVPTWINDYYYYRCEEYYWSDNTYSWSDPYIDYGITTANQTATSASIDAAAARTVTDAFTTNGLLTDYWWPAGTGDNHTGGQKWNVALTSTGKMLIGANAGLWIAKSTTYSDGAAVVIDNSGIALNAATVHIRAQQGDSNDVVSLSSSGIKIGSSGSITLSATKNLIINGGNFKITSAGAVIMTGTVTATSGKIGSTLPWNITNGRLYSGTGATYVALDSGKSGTNGTDYVIWAGKTPTITNNTEVFKDSNGNDTFLPPFGVTRNGSIRATAGTIGGWTLKNKMLYSEVSNYAGTGMSANTTEVTFDNNISIDGETEWNSMSQDQKNEYIRLRKATNYSYSLRIPDSTKSSDTIKYKSGFYAFWAGDDDPEKAPFRVTRDGEVFVEKLIAKEVTTDENNNSITKIETYNLSGFNSGSGGGAGGWVATQANLKKDLIINTDYGVTDKKEDKSKLVLTASYKGNDIKSITYSLARDGDTIKLNNDKGLTIIPEFLISKYISSDLTAKFTPLTAGSYDSEKQKIIFEGRIVIGYNEVNEEDPAGEPTWTTLKTFDKEDIQVSYTDNSTINSSFDIYLAETEIYTPPGTNIEEERTNYTKISSDRNSPTPISGTQVLYIRNGNQENDTSSGAYYIQGSGTTGSSTIYYSLQNIDSGFTSLNSDITIGASQFWLNTSASKTNAKKVTIPTCIADSSGNRLNTSRSSDSDTVLYLCFSNNATGNTADNIQTRPYYLPTTSSVSDTIYYSLQNISSSFTSLNNNTTIEGTNQFWLNTSASTTNAKKVTIPACIADSNGNRLSTSSSSNSDTILYLCFSNKETGNTANGISTIPYYLSASTGSSTIYYSDDENSTPYSALEEDVTVFSDHVFLSTSQNGTASHKITTGTLKDIYNLCYWIPGDGGSELDSFINEGATLYASEMKYGETNEIHLGWNNNKTATIILSGGSSQGGGISLNDVNLYYKLNNGWQSPSQPINLGLKDTIQIGFGLSSDSVNDKILTINAPTGGDTTSSDYVNGWHAAASQMSTISGDTIGTPDQFKVTFPSASTDQTGNWFFGLRESNGAIEVYKTSQPTTTLASKTPTSSSGAQSVHIVDYTTGQDTDNDEQKIKFIQRSNIYTSSNSQAQIDITVGVRLSNGVQFSRTMTNINVGLTEYSGGNLYYRQFNSSTHSYEYVQSTNRTWYYK